MKIIGCTLFAIIAIFISSFNACSQPGVMEGETEFMDSVPKNSPDTKHLYLKVGVQGGLAQTSTNDLPAGYSRKPRMAWGVSLNAVLDLGNAMQLTSGIHYQKGGVKVASGDINGGPGSLDLYYITVPLIFETRLGKQKHITLGTGPYAGLLVPAIQKGRFNNPPDLRKYDAGLLVTAGYRLAPRWSLEANAQWGLVDIDKARNTYFGKNLMSFLKINFLLLSDQKARSIYKPIIKIKPKGG